MKTQIAKVVYASGWMLIIDSASKAPLLLLEWCTSQKEINPIHRVINNQDGVLKIRLNGMGEDYKDCAKYINDNQ